MAMIPFQVLDRALSRRISLISFFFDGFLILVADRSYVFSVTLTANRISGTPNYRPGPIEAVRCIPWPEPVEWLVEGTRFVLVSFRNLA